jgi:hypothetical protein
MSPGSFQTLAAAGIDMGMGDSLIAGIVLVHRGILLTRNRRHFERVSDLRWGGSERSRFKLPASLAPTAGGTLLRRAMARITSRSCQ